MTSNKFISNQENDRERFYNLETHFEQVCNKHPHLKLLESQWRFDQELISKALQNIGSTFPHYSRHDASHSKQIIINIERMLGDKIQYLSATDTWLILEAAYNHDIGMVVTHKQIQDMETPEFQEFVKDIARKPNDSLHRFAKKWIKDKARLPKGADAHHFFNEYIQLIAEWYRRKHPVNSARIVRDPYNEIGLDSPRNELLPSRLFNVLANICRAHGDDFDEMMKLLPKAEAGMAVEDCHPRYVACLLRMGDLLDLDDNRFCPVMMNMCGHQLPKTSKSHYDKHHSIKHFRLDSERIEVESECPTPDSYEVAHEWFKWLEGEYYKQTQNWDRIVPSKELGRLPTLTTPKVNIAAPYLVLEQGKKPSFKVDQGAILELVRGTGLYSSKFDSIREILQNAVDATLIAIWQNHNKEIEGLNPTSPELAELLSQYPIRITFEPDSQNQEYWTLRVQDLGTGISFDTLQYMLDIGSSSKNRKKTSIVEEMPTWYRPSGNFGIGLQSAYLITDKFIIKTKSRITHQGLMIKFTTKQNKSVIIKQINDDLPYGSTFEAKIKINPFPKTIRWEFGREDEIAKQLIGYDFTKDGSDLKCYETISIIASIIEFSNESPIPISYKHINLKRKIDYFFDKEENVLLSDISFINSDHSRIITNFRGQPFSDFNNHNLRCLQVTADFYGYNAKDFLTYNREKILPDAKSKATKSLIKAVLNYIEANFKDIPEEQKPYAAAFYFFNSKIDIDKIPDFILNALKLFEIYIDNSAPITLEEILEKIQNREIAYLCESRSTSSTEKNLISKAGSGMAFDLIQYMSTKKGLFYTKEISSVDQYGYKYIWSTIDVQPLSDQIIRNILSQRERFLEVGCRYIFPCWSKYRYLAVIIKVNWARGYDYLSASNDLMVLPCIFNSEHGTIVEFDESEELSLWIYNHRKKQEVTFEEIRRLHLELVLELKKIAIGENLDYPQEDIEKIIYKPMNNKLNLLFIK